MAGKNNETKMTDLEKQRAEAIEYVKKATSLVLFYSPGQRRWGMVFHCEATTISDLLAELDVLRLDLLQTSLAQKKKDAKDAG